MAALNERQAKRMPMLFSPTAPPSPPETGSYGSAARLAAPRTQLTFARSTVTATRKADITLTCRDVAY